MFKRIVFPLALLLAGLALTALAFVSVRDADRDAQRASFDRAAERAVATVKFHLMQPAYGLAGARGAAALRGNGVPTLAEVRAYVGARDLPAEFPGVWGIGLIVPVQRADLPAFEQSVRDEGGEAFTVRSEGDRPDLFVIKTIEPQRGNFHAIGFDVGAEPNRRAAAERAMRTGEPTVTGPIHLVQDAEKRPAALLMSPVFASGGAHLAGPEDRVIALYYAAMVYDDLMAATRENPDQSAWLRLKVVDVGADAVVHDTHKDDGGWPGALVATQRFDYFGRPFEVRVQSTPAFLQAHPLTDGALIVLLGVLTSVLAALAAHQQGRMRARAERLAAAMTRDLDRLAAVARLTGNAVVITDVEGRAEWVNPAFRSLTGYTDDELIGRKPGAMLQTDDTDAAEVARLSAAIEKRQPYTGVLLNRSKQGRPYHVEIEVQPITDADGGLQGFIGVQADITEQLEREEALRASRALLEKTGEVSGVGGWRLGLASNTLHWTAETRRIHEVPDEYVPDVPNAIQFYAPESRGPIRDAITRAIDTGEPWDLELGFITYTGRLRWVRAVGEVEMRDGKAFALHGAIVDVTETVEERKRLALERERLALILQGTDAGTWEWNVQTGETRFNARWAEIVGYAADELAPTSIDTWARLAHPEDLERSNAALQRHFSGEAPRYECEARMRHREGHWVWVLDRGRVMTWTADGKPEWMFGTHLDITERKQAELRLAESEALLSTTLHSIGDAVLTADAEARVTWINPVAEALTGWTNEEARGRLAMEVLHLEIDGRDGRAPCPVRACLDEGRKVGLAGSTVLVSRSGARYVVEDSAAPLRDGDGPVRGVVLVFHDVTEKARLATEMSYRATHDALTGLVNRAELESTLEDALARVRKRDTEGALMFIDLDHFKVVNDACGHAAGDRLLAQIAALLRSGVRARDVVARFGGDEFAILLEDCPLPRAQAIAEKILEAVDGYRFVSEDGRRFRVGMSIGMVPVDKRWINLAQLVQGADAACYTAKTEGRGRVVVDQGVLQIGDTPRRDVTWGPLIEQALDDDLFELYAQRVVPLRNELVAKLRCEVLLRLRGSDGRMVSPAEFIPAAERYQLASRIDRWVLRNVLQALSDVPLAGIGRVAINLSGQSVGDRAFHRFAVQAIAESGLPAEVLCVEITETAVVTNFADAARFIEDLRALGVQVALDDFGAGASSFGYLKSLAVDVLKIDGQFVRGLLQGQLEAAALRSFVDVAGVLGLRTVAEQVETEAVAARLLQLGVDFGQGYHFHRPEPIGDLLRAATSEPQRVARLKLVAPDDGRG